MATYYNHCQVGIVDASGNVNVIYPQTYASDVKVGTANSSIGITTSSTVQSLISALGSAAIKNVGDLVTNSASSSSTSQAYSCNQINSKLNELNSNTEYKYYKTGIGTENIDLTKIPYTILHPCAYLTIGGVYCRMTTTILKMEIEEDNKKRFVFGGAGVSATIMLSQKACNLLYCGDGSSTNYVNVAAIDIRYR